MKILGIESSCDETAAAVVEYKNRKFRELSNVVHSQIEIHKKTEGVVPEVAARAHVEEIVPIIDRALEKMSRTSARVNMESEIDAIAVTGGPGLLMTLLVGVEAAKTLGWVYNKPVIRVNHMFAHLAVNHLLNQSITYPALGLLVSGGHTELIWMTSPTKMKKLGETKDDAAGEAFDKVAKMLGLPYPGGPVVSKKAQAGDPRAFDFPRPMLTNPGYDFSFSGLKTAVLYQLDDMTKPEKARYTADICASFEQAVVDTLVGRTIQAARTYKPKSILLAGGVAANNQLRRQLTREAEGQFNITPLMPPLEYTGDNAAMIATAGALMYAKKKKRPPLFKLAADPNWELPKTLKEMA